MASRGGKLKEAKQALKQRRFARVIALLEPLVIEYRDSFDFFYTLGLACLYSGDAGGALSYFQRARQIKMRDVNLLLAQAVLFLRRGNTSKAVECYLEVQELEGGNKTAAAALDFIRKNGDEDTISDWVADGRIMRFYPPVGKNTRFLRVALICLAVILTASAVFFLPRLSVFKAAEREDLRFLDLTAEEKGSFTEKNLSGSIRYILTEKQIASSYQAARDYFQDYRDNAAQVEVNRLLLSNASAVIREKVKTLAGHFKIPAFDTLKDNYTFAQIETDPPLYENCYVIWSGRVTNVRQNGAVYECDFLAGYDTMTKIDGIIPLILNQPVSIDAEKPLKILAKITLNSGRAVLFGQAVFQSVQDTNMSYK